jgi:hypothetical protein
MSDPDNLVELFDAADEPPPPDQLDLEIDVTFQKRRFTSLHLEEPTILAIERAERMLNVPPPAITALHIRQYQIELVAAVAKVPREVVLELRHSELTRAFDFLSGLLEPIQPDGAT